MQDNKIIVGILQHQKYASDPNRGGSEWNTEIHFKSRDLTVAFDKDFCELRFVRRQTLAEFQTPNVTDYLGNMTEIVPLGEQEMDVNFVDACEAWLKAKEHLESQEKTIVKLVNQLSN